MHHSTVFNGNVVSRAKAAVCPLDAEDVSRFALFFIPHRLRLILFAELFSFATNIRYHCPSKRAVMAPGVGLLEGMS